MYFLCLALYLVQIGLQAKSCHLTGGKKVLHIKITQPSSCILLTFCLDDVRHIQTFIHPQHHCSVLKVKGVTVIKKIRTLRISFSLFISHTVSVFSTDLLKYSHITLHFILACRLPVFLEANH